MNRLAKHKSILDFLARLTSELDPSLWEVVDHWDGDLHAIGVALRAEPRVLMYVSTWRQPPGRYFCALETPPVSADDAPYRPAGEGNGVEFPELLCMLKVHLSLPA